MKQFTRRRIRLVAILALIVYAIVRFVLVGALFESYGVNPWIFLAIDCLTSVTYVLGLEYLVAALQSKHQVSGWYLLGWGLLAAVSFAAPYIYVFMASRTLPGGLALGLGVVVVLLLANAVVSLQKRVRRNRTK